MVSSFESSLAANLAMVNKKSESRLTYFSTSGSTSSTSTRGAIVRSALQRRQFVMSSQSRVYCQYRLSSASLMIRTNLFFTSSLFISHSFARISPLISELSDHFKYSLIMCEKKHSDCAICQAFYWTFFRTLNQLELAKP